MPPIAANANSSDLDKLFAALSALTSIQSLDDVLASFGLKDLPSAQKYGIIGGCITFALTVTTVIILLVMGGSFQRMAEQAESGESTVPTVVEARIGRPLILERLVEARDRMVKNYKQDEEKMAVKQGDRTVLTKLLLNIAPDIAKATALMGSLIDETDKCTIKNDELKKYLPEGYEENYIDAYRLCQDKPGGKNRYILIQSLAFLRLFVNALSHSGNVFSF